MQFLREDDHHLDSCWMTWNSPETRLKFVTFPMVHMADPRYYERLGVDLARCRYVLVEGVSWRLGDRRRPLYDLAARNLGLVTQEKALKTPPQVTAINIDMRRSEFRARFLELPLRYVFLSLGLRWLLWLVTAPPLFRREILRHGILRRQRRSSLDASPWYRLIVGGRDRRIVENLHAFYREHGLTEETSYVGIVFGASHMPAIAEGLRRIGFQAATRRWVEVLRIDARGNVSHA